MNGEELAEAAGVDPLIARFAISRRTLRPGQQRDLSLLTIIAHDLRSPLANLAVLIESMETAALAGDAAGLCARKQSAYRLIQHLDALLGGMLNRARTKGDPLRLDSEQIDLAEVVNAALDVNQPIAERRAITLSHSGSSATSVLGDRTLLVEAVDNLLSNAIRHSEPRSTIDCEVLERGSRAVIRVRDRGCGLTERQMRRLFQPFASSCGRNDLKGDGNSGCGLGLWIAKLIAERHGGHIEASSPGADLGAVFELHLPVARRRCRRQASGVVSPQTLRGSRRQMRSGGRGDSHAHQL